MGLSPLQVLLVPINGHELAPNLSLNRLIGPSSYLSPFLAHSLHVIAMFLSYWAGLLGRLYLTGPKSALDSTFNLAHSPTFLPEPLASPFARLEAGPITWA